MNLRTAVLLVATACGCHGGYMTYGTAVHFEVGKPLRFDDLTLEYVGDRHVPGPNNAPWQFTFKRFRITGASGEQTVEWSSGTGDIAPQPFDYGGHHYQLELAFTEHGNHRLGPDELVLTRQ